MRESIGGVSDLTGGWFGQLAEQRLPQHAAKRLHRHGSSSCVARTCDRGQAARRSGALTPIGGPPSGEARKLYIRLYGPDRLRAQGWRLARKLLERDLADLLQRAGADQSYDPASG